MKIAIVGTGISGLVAAYLLSREHDISVFEANDYIGGHTVTSRLQTAAGPLDVDAGFIVYNETSYPNFVRLLGELGVESQPTTMSFSVRSERSSLEYAGTNLNTFFAQRTNLLRPSHYRLARDILRFNEAARAGLRRGLHGTLREFLAANHLGPHLVENYVVPLTAAIWSTEPDRALGTPAEFILRFLDNHRLLGTSGYHIWRVIRGGSQRYVDRLIVPFADRIRLQTPVHRLRRAENGVEVSSEDGTEIFDQVVVATHSNQALRMLVRPSAAELEVLGAIGYQANHAILHTDAAALPTKRRAWAAWNYRVPRDRSRALAVTYNMTLLQSLPTRTPYCVSLNMDDSIRPDTRLREFHFEHPLFTEAAVAAQARHAEISGVDRIHYCGAYWRHGFHEDGVVSALEVCRRLGVTL